jgi:predicted O-linked N-acetylglucosamine transferase (SPINDLY family)
LYSNRYPDEGDDARSQEFRNVVGPERWRWTRGWDTEDLFKQIRRDSIDVLVEMAGHTAHARLDVMARKAAPVQVEWLGYPNTTGLTRIDYRFSDAVTEPEGTFDARSTETIYRLPNGFHLFAPPDYTPEPAPAPCLKNGYVTFGTYNNMNKLGSQSIELWAELLKKVASARIIIKHSTLKVLDNRESLRSEFAKYGIQSWRVDLRETTAGHKQHLESYADIDIALDPLFYNGTTTTCDALSVGVPVLTKPGHTHSARVSASLIHRIGMDGWIARDREHFLEIGRRAAQNFEMLNAVRSQIRKAFDASPLRDGPAMARDLETAYREMWDDFCQRGHSRPFQTTTPNEELNNGN